MSIQTEVVCLIVVIFLKTKFIWNNHEKNKQHRI